MKEKNLFDLSKKTIVVTGACGLLGRNHCKAIAEAGGNPIVLDLNEQDAVSFARELSEEFSVRSSGYSVDITVEQEIHKNALSVRSEFGEIDGLVNNAANNPKMENSSGKDFQRLENFSLDSWKQDIAVGLTGAFLCSKHYGKIIEQNPNGGVIINVSSDLGLIAPDQRLYSEIGLTKDEQPVKPITYSVIKSGLLGLTRYLATYWPEKVRCNAICPGGVEAGQTKEFLENVSRCIPLGRLAQAYEYKGTLIYLLSEASSYLNGSIIPIDGGRTCW